MNQVILMGRLTKDPIIRTTQSGKMAASFSVAISDGKDAAGKDRTEFVNCVAWEKTAEIIGNHLKKGSGVMVTGRLATRSYDGNDGVKRYVTEVIVSRMEFPPGPPKEKPAADDLGGFGTEVPEGDEMPF